MVIFVRVLGPFQVAPRLAIAAMNVNEDRDARKSIRDVFGAGVNVLHVVK